MENIIINVVLALSTFVLTWVTIDCIYNKYIDYRVRKHEADKIAEQVRNQVSCDTCKCLMNKEEAYSVRYYPYVFYYDITFKYYCKIHAPKYEKQYYDKFYKELEVTEQGEPVGYIKKK